MSSEPADHDTGTSNGWDTYWANEANRPYWERADPHFAAWLRTLDRACVGDALDLGCGIGRHIPCLVDRGFRVTAVDSSVQALQEAGRRLAASPASPTFRLGSYGDDLFLPNTFDLVVAYNVIYHGTRCGMETAINNVHRWLRSGGLLYFTCPSRRDDKYGRGELVESNTYRPDNSVHPGDIHYFADADDLERLLAAYRIRLREMEEHYWDNAGQRQFSSQWRIVAEKRRASDPDGPKDKLSG